MNTGKTTLKYHAILTFIFSAFILTFLWGCGTGADSKTTPPTDATAAAIRLSASSTSVKSDGSTNTTITVMALNDKNAALNGIKVTMSTNTGVISAENVTTNTTTPATVTFSSPGKPINRTAWITATAGTVTAQIPIKIEGSTVTLEPSATSIPIDGATNVILTIVTKDAGNNVVPNAEVTLTQAGAGNVTIAQTTDKTDETGTFKATIQGKTAGVVNLTASALGATATINITVTNPGGNFAIDQQKLNGVIIANNAMTAMKIKDTLEIRVNAPTATSVTFVSSIGTWENGASSRVVTPDAVTKKATATLKTTVAGISSVAVYDDLNNKDSRTVAMSSGADPAKITITALPANVPVSVGSTTGSSTLTATVRDIDNNLIGGSAVMFTIINPQGTETVSPVIVTTASDTNNGLSIGEARTTFTAGSTSSTSDGIQIRATVVGTNINTAGNDAKIVIGGVAGSIAFSDGTKIGTLYNDTVYSLPITVSVADSAGAGVPGAEVSLSVWPIAWSTGTACAFDSDNGINEGTFWNEDVNENMFLEPGEDGNRSYYATGALATTPGTTNGELDPANSVVSTSLSKVVTDEAGFAPFKLNYPKKSAIWTMVRLRATTKVRGTENRTEKVFRLQALEDDVVPNCLLGSSPYKF